MTIIGVFIPIIPTMGVPIFFFVIVIFPFFVIFAVFSLGVVTFVVDAGKVGGGRAGGAGGLGGGVEGMLGGRYGGGGGATASGTVTPTATVTGEVESTLTPKLAEMSAGGCATKLVAEAATSV